MADNVMLANYVKFVRGTPSAFEKVANKDPNTLYFVSEADSNKGLLYLGNKVIGDGELNNLVDIEGMKDAENGQYLVYNVATHLWEPYTLSPFTGATAETAGTSGLVPVPPAGSQNMFLAGDGEWKSPQGAIDAAIKEVNDRIDDLIGDEEADQDKSIREIAAEVLAEQLIPEDAQESLDTLQEIADWIQNHPADASELAADVADLKEQVATLETTQAADKAALEAEIDDVRADAHADDLLIYDDLSDLIKALSWTNLDENGNPQEVVIPDKSWNLAT